jgi:hypothetical protein
LIYVPQILQYSGRLIIRFVFLVRSVALAGLWKSLMPAPGVREGPVQGVGDALGKNTNG